ncbi:MAG TPA: hypothetical protein VI895_00295 [Bdellovibrionota bacterium]|nr:hypothetical protein [Bdellovibrionota bacterium]
MTMMLRTRFSSSIMLAVLFCAFPVDAKIGDPKPLKIGHMLYRTHSNYVEAIDTRSSKVIWKTIVYPTIEPKNLDRNLEKDAQLNIITSIKEAGEYLLVQNKKGEQFYLDPRTGKLINQPSLETPDPGPEFVSCGPGMKIPTCEPTGPKTPCNSDEECWCKAFNGSKFIKGKVDRWRVCCTKEKLKSENSGNCPVVDHCQACLYD